METTTITIARDTAWWLNWSPITVYFDNEELGVLQNHEALQKTLPLQEQFVHLKVTVGPLFKENISFKIRPVETTTFTIISGLRITTLLMGVLLGGTSILRYQIKRRYLLVSILLLGFAVYRIWDNIIKIEYDPNDIYHRKRERV